MSRLRVVLVALLLAVVSVGCATARAEAPTEPPHVEPRTGASEAAALAAAWDEAAAQAAWTEGVARGEWFAGIERAERERLAAVARSTPVRSPSGNAAGAGVGDCTGFAVPDYVIQRESRGNPAAVNSSSGAYGCTQIMPAWWGSWCSHLDRTTLDGQRECTQIVLDRQGPGAWSETW